MDTCLAGGEREGWGERRRGWGDEGGVLLTKVLHSQQCQRLKIQARETASCVVFELTGRAPEPVAILLGLNAVNKLYVRRETSILPYVWTETDRDLSQSTSCLLCVQRLTMTYQSAYVFFVCRN